MIVYVVIERRGLDLSAREETLSMFSIHRDMGNAERILKTQRAMAVHYGREYRLRAVDIDKVLPVITEMWELAGRVEHQMGLGYK